MIGKPHNTGLIPPKTRRLTKMIDILNTFQAADLAVLPVDLMDDISLVGTIAQPKITPFEILDVSVVGPNDPPRPK